MAHNRNVGFSTLGVNTDVADPSTGLEWLNQPKSYAIEVGGGLKVTPTPGSDYWRKTYMEPPADRASGNALVAKIPPDVGKWSVSTEFSMTLVDQFDQAGLMVYVDNEHWLKTGIEYEGGVPNMSCVVTNNQSDWNYFPWPSSVDVSIMVELQRCVDNVLYCTVQYCEAGVWRILRAAPIYMSEGSEVSVGIMLAAPKSEEGKPAMEAVFKYLNISSL